MVTIVRQVSYGGHYLPDLSIDSDLEKPLGCSQTLFDFVQKVIEVSDIVLFYISIELDSTATIVF